MNTTWRAGNWTVNVEHGWLMSRRGILRRRVYPDSRVMSVLATFLAKPGELISTDEILAAAWSGRVVTRDSVSTAIYQLRQILGDDSSTPMYIRTETRRGYRFIARVEPWQQPTRPWRLAATVASVGMLAILGLTVQTDHLEIAATDSPQLYIVPLENVTGDVKMKPLAIAMDATLVSAIVRMNPRTVAARPGDAGSSLRLESLIVACDMGPSLVVHLFDVHKRHYLWSRAYPLDAVFAEPTVVEHVAREVTAELARTRT